MGFGKKILVLLCFNFVLFFTFTNRASAATYPSSGQFTSINILSGQGVRTIDKFGYNASAIPANTSIKVQFSQDGTTWKNSAGATDGWDSLSVGDHLAEVDAIDLSGLGWINGYFYYKVLFETTDTTATPVLDEVVVYYSPGVSIDTVNITGTTPTQTTANGNILALEGGNATRRGFKYGLTQADTWDTYEDGDFGTGTYSLNITGLNPNTTYYVRAYATNPNGTTYGEWKSITTGLYATTGTMTSGNILAGETVVSIDSFDYNLVEKPSGTGASVQFSQNGTSWYSSAGVLDGSNTLEPGLNQIDLRALGWEGANFYYKVSLTANSERSQTPVLESVGVNYNLNSAPADATSPTQLKNNEVTEIANEGYTNETNVKLKASATDPDTVESINLFFEVVTDGGSFSSPATPAVGTSCVSGTAYADCANNIWYITSDFNDYSTAPYTGTVNITGLSDGTGYKWQVKACDDTDACSAWVVFNAITPNFIIDTSPPTVPGTPSTTSPTADTTPTWSFGASSDSGSGLASVSYTVGWCTNSDFSGCEANIDTSATNSYTQTSALSDGTWYFRVKAKDALDNESSYSENGSVVIDTASPTTTDDVDGAWHNNDVVVTLSCDDGAGTGCAATYYTTDGSDPTLSSSSGTSFTLSSEGIYTIKYFSVDNTGNSESVKQAGNQVKIDLTNPANGSILINSGNSTTATRAVTFAISSSDSGGSGLYQMIISENSDFSDASWETYDTSKSFTLSEGDGTKTVYLKFKDNAGNESYAVSDSITLDMTEPTGVTLESPGDREYTNSERPIFRWKATSDATAGLSRYALEIDNPSASSGQASGDIVIDNIPTTGTKDITTPKYVIRYENFSDSDSGNDYIAVYTKSSGEWSEDSNSGQNDGKLREGKVSWKVKAVDNAGNETSSGRTLFVDRTAPSVEITQLNDSQPARNASHSVAGGFSINNFQSTDKTPTIYGKITDTLAGGDSSQAQNQNGPRVASGPKQVEIKVEKKEGLGYKLHTLYTINMDKSWYACDNKEVSDNSKQKCNKYLPFEYTQKDALDFGTYKITLTGKDKADNSAEISFILNITSLSEIITPEEEKVIEEEIKELPEEEKEKVREEIEITKPEPVSETSEGFGKTLGDFFGGIVRGIGQGVRLVFNSIGSGIAYLAFTVGENTQGVFGDFSLAIIKFAYNFVPGPTTIADVNATALSPTSVKITWETNHPASGKVNWGYEDGVYEFELQESKRTTEHEFILTNLTPDTEYHYEVMSQNKNYVYGANRKFRTPKNNI